MNNTEPSYLDAVAYADRNEVIAELKKLLKARTGRTWSVTGGRGTSWGWITITAPPKRRDGYQLADEDRAELEAIFGRVGNSHSIPSSVDYRRQALRQAAGLDFVAAEPYWD